MNTSKERMIAVGKERIAEKQKMFGTKAEEITKLQDKFVRKVMRLLGAGKAFIVGDSPTKCLVCGRPLRFNNAGQIVKYCSKAHRRMRHNRKRILKVRR